MGAPDRVDEESIEVLIGKSELSIYYEHFTGHVQVILEPHEIQLIQIAKK